jgi:Flp pilus assembly protein TadG
MNDNSTASNGRSFRSYPTIAHQVSDGLITAGNHRNKHKSRFRLIRECRAGVAFIVAIMLPVLIGFGALGIETAQVSSQKALLKQTVTAAALAGANLIASYYTTGSTTTIVNAAQAIALANMPSAKYGTVVPNPTCTNGSVLLGNWNATTSTFTSLCTSGTTSPDAVQVTGYQTAANHNPVSLFLSSLIGWASYDTTATATASYGTGQTFNTIVINDLSGSFSGQISAQKAADTSILNCISSASGTASKFGVTTIDGSSTIYEPLTQVSTNLTAIQTKINALDSCGNGTMPACSGSNVASGIYSAIQQFSGTSYLTSKNSVIVITDGVPNFNSSHNYVTVDGIGPTTTPATTQVCSGTGTGSSNCSDTKLLTMATNQAAAARNAKVSISTIYYNGNTTASSALCTAAGLSSSCTTAQLQTAYATSLAALSGGTGISLVAPTVTGISSSFAAFCATMASSLKAVSH